MIVGVSDMSPIVCVEYPIEDVKVEVEGFEDKIVLEVEYPKIIAL